MLLARQLYKGRRDNLVRGRLSLEKDMLIPWPVSSGIPIKLAVVTRGKVSVKPHEVLLKVRAKPL